MLSFEQNKKQKTNKKMRLLTKNRNKKSSPHKFLDKIRCDFQKKFWIRSFVSIDMSGSYVIF